MSPTPSLEQLLALLNSQQSQGQGGYLQQQGPPSGAAVSIPGGGNIPLGHRPPSLLGPSSQSGAVDTSNGIGTSPVIGSNTNGDLIVQQNPSYANGNPTTNGGGFWQTLLHGLSRGLAGGGAGQNSQSNASPNSSGAGQGGALSQMLQGLIGSGLQGIQGAQTSHPGTQGMPATGGNGDMSPQNLQQIFQAIAARQAVEQMTQGGGAQTSANNMNVPGAQPMNGSASSFPWWLTMNRPS